MEQRWYPPGMLFSIEEERSFCFSSIFCLFTKSVISRTMLIMIILPSFALTTFPLSIVQNHEPSFLGIR